MSPGSPPLSCRALPVSAHSKLHLLAYFQGLLESGSLEERKATIRGFIKEVVRKDGAATVRHTLPEPSNHEKEKVLNSELFGGAGGIRTLCLFNAIEALSQLSYSPA